MTETPVAGQGPQIAGVFVPEIDRQGTRADLHKIAIAAELLVVGHRRIKIGESATARALGSQHQETIAIGRHIGHEMLHIKRAAELSRA